MITFSFFRRRLLLMVASVFFGSALLVAQSVSAEPDELHEFTIYTMPTFLPLDWGSPAGLYTSMKTCYLKTLTVPDNYLLGHVAVELKSPLLKNRLLIAQTSSSTQEKLDLVFKQKVGFGILGAALHGRIETDKELNHKLQVYAKRKMLAFITFRINQKAAQRIIDFVNTYTLQDSKNMAPCDFYGGAFWPGYHNEGAGCSAFGIALLDAINLAADYTQSWKVQVNIPMNLIGGEYNKNKRIKNQTIKRSKSWHSGNGRANVDFVEYFVYEPSVIFDWIMKKRMQNDTVFTSALQADVPGLYVDARAVTADKDKQLFVQRPKPNLFIDHFYQKNRGGELFLNKN